MKVTRFDPGLELIRSAEGRILVDRIAA